MASKFCLWWKFYQFKGSDTLRFLILSKKETLSWYRFNLTYSQSSSPYKWQTKLPAATNLLAVIWGIATVSLIESDYRWNLPAIYYLQITNCDKYNPLHLMIHAFPYRCFLFFCHLKWFCNINPIGINCNPWPLNTSYLWRFCIINEMLVDFGGFKF